MRFDFLPRLEQFRFHFLDFYRAHALKSHAERSEASPAAFPVFSMTAFTVLAHWKAFSASRFRMTFQRSGESREGEDTPYFQKSK